MLQRAILSQLQDRRPSERTMLQRWDAPTTQFRSIEDKHRHCSTPRGTDADAEMKVDRNLPPSHPKHPRRLEDRYLVA